MSGGDEEHLRREQLEEADEAFIDLEDPNLEILDEDDEGDANDKDSLSDGDDNANEEDNEEGNDDEEANADGDLQQGAEMVDLNAAPDREPERDDALATFCAPGGKPIHAVAAHPLKPHLLAASGEGEEVYILSLDETEQGAGWTLLHTLKGHGDTVSLLSFSPNGEWLATGSLDSTVGLWSTASWERVHSLTDLYGEIMSLLWHPSSLVLVAGADDAQAAMWNVNKGTLAMYFVGHRGPVTCCTWSPDNKKLLTGSSDGSISVYSPKTGEQEVNVNKDLSPDNAGITRVVFVNDDQCVIGCEDGTMHVFSLRSGRVVSHLEDLHEQAIESLAVSDNGALLISASCDCKVIVWNLADYSARATLEVGESVIPAVWARGTLVVAGCSDGDVRVWDGRSSQQEPLAVRTGHRRMILSLCVMRSTGNTAAAGQREFVVSGADDGLVKCFALPESTS